MEGHMSEENKALVRRFVDEFQTAGKAEVANELAAADLIHHSGPAWTRADTVGPHGAKQVIATLRAAFPDLHAVIHDQIAEGDKVVTRKTFHGTHRGQFRGVSPTGKPVSINIIDIVRIAGGQMAEHWSAIDWMGLMQQLETTPAPEPTAKYFDGWYADMTGSPVKDEIQQRHLGLPPHLLSTSLLGWDGVAEAVTALRLSPGGTLVDLGCGRGGYGLEIAARSGARLVGVDFSAEAVRQAREHARRLGAATEFRIGDLAATGLDAGSADAVLCVDAIHFAPRPGAAYREIRRILAAGGRVALTCWEPVQPGDERVPERLRHVDVRAGLTAAGFGDIEVGDRAGWRARERAMWAEAAALDPGDDPALRSFRDEGVRSLAIFGLLRRVMAAATAS
jgi:predicted ester cyclase/SAM-dependent methyltransferase